MRIDGGILTYQPNARHLQEEKTPKGRKVVFIGVNGSERDQQKAKENLEVGETYTVEEIYVDRYSSEVRLQECPRYLFNTVLFEDLETENESDDFLPPEESEKVLLTKEQAEAIEWHRSYYTKNDLILENHFYKGVPPKLHKPLHITEIETDKLVSALYNGYEVEEPTPLFEPGDLAIHEGLNKIVTIDKYHKPIHCYEFGGTGMVIGESVLRKPSQDEIFWLHDLKRDCVNDFREGDIVLRGRGEVYVVGNDRQGETILDYCTLCDAISWAEKGRIEYIYPVESRKPYRKGEL